MTTNNRSCLFRAIVGVALAIALLFFLAIVTLFFGPVSGDEFSPDTFQRRSFSYYQLPLLRIQITPIKRLSDTGPVEQYLVDKRLISSTGQSAPSWDLVDSTEGFVRTVDGDAKILRQYLDLQNGSGSYHWKAWSIDNPARASVFWPLVAEVVRQHLYILLPEMFQLARDSDSPQQLKKDLDQLLADNYRRLGQTQYDLGDYEAAYQLLTDSLTHLPDDPDTLSNSRPLL